MSQAYDWIQRLGLVNHPEGGWFRETYRSAGAIGSCCLTDHPDGPRSICTAIYYLLESGDYSALHRIRSDEIWHHYAGDALELHLLDASGARRLDLDPASCPQVVVPSGTWFGARPVEGGEAGYALVGCTVAPGFDFRDFEIGRRERLLRDFPDHAVLVRRLTRDG